MITVLCGGVGAAKFLEGLVHANLGEEIVAIVNVGDDEEMYGLHISPDIDTIVYTLSDLVDRERGWGVKGETYQALNRLKELGAPAWFTLGDRDIGLHLFRRHLLDVGHTLSEATAEIGKSHNIPLRMLPSTNQRLRTMILAHGETEELLSFQRYFVERRHQPTVKGIFFTGSSEAKAAPGVLDAIEASRIIVIAPSNPLLSIAPILAIDEIAKAMAAARHKTIAISPIVGGRAIKGPADRILDSLGYPVSPLGAAKILAPFISMMVIDDVDTNLSREIEELGLEVFITNTMMVDLATKVELAKSVTNVSKELQ
ncbi:MAG: 2-phospho-L-lactate transferase [Actinomycetota bacterium]|nr:2-phospho-L-lactate transferase [Actinomycetota bacterium]